MSDTNIFEEFGDIPVNIKQAIINERMQQWKNTQFKATVDASVARKLQDKQLEADAIKEMTMCETAIQQLKLLLTEIKQQP